MNGSVAAITDPPRTSKGQFAPGHSGNPAGRPKGARNRMTLAAEALLEESGEGLIRKLIDDAFGGDRRALLFLAGRLCPANAEPPITLDLAPGREGDFLHIHALTVRAMADGELTPKQAHTVVRILEVGAKLKELQCKLARSAARSESKAPSRAAKPVSSQYSDAESETAARPLPNLPLQAGEGKAAPVSDQHSKISLAVPANALTAPTPPLFRKGERKVLTVPPASGLYFSRAAMRASTALSGPPVSGLYFPRAA